MRSIVLLALMAVLLPVVGQAADKTITVEFSFEVPADKAVENYLLYRDGILACTIPVEPDYIFECAVFDTPTGSNYTLAAHYTDESDSPLSPPYWFSFSAPRRIKINGVKARIVLPGD